LIYRKHFELNEARETLVLVKPVIEKIIKLKKILDKKKISEDKYFFMGTIGKNGDGEYPAEMYEITDLISSLIEKGIQIKSLDFGLIDFPHIRINGEEVFLCYKLDETTILYWHGLEEGFSGRKPVEIL